MAKKERKKEEKRIEREETEEFAGKSYFDADLLTVFPRGDTVSLERGLKHDLSESVDETIIQTESKIVGLKAALKAFYKGKEGGEELEDEELRREVRDLNEEEIVALAKRILEKNKRIRRKKDG